MIKTRSGCDEGLEEKPKSRLGALMVEEGKGGVSGRT